MADANYVQSSFLGGEVSLSTQGRIDRPDYRTMMNVCLNSFPIEAGAWTRRPGSKFAQTTRSGAEGRTIAFAFKETTPYTMEFTDGHLRFFNVDQLVTTNDDQPVTSISTANPAKVLTGTHGWASADQVFFAGLGTSMPLLQNRVFIATVTSSTEFTLTDAVSGATIDGSTLGTLPADVTVRRVRDIATPYATGSWADVRSVQAEKQAILLHGSVMPQTLVATPATASEDYATFALDPAVFKDGPYFDPVAGGALITPNAVSGSLTLTLSFPAYVATRVYSKGDFASYSSVNYRSIVDQNLNNQPDTHATQWEAVSAGAAVGPDGFTGSDFGRMMRLYSEPPVWDTATTYAIGNVVAFAGTYWSALTAMTGAAASPGTINPNQPGTKATTWAVNAAGAVWSWGKITGFSNQISQSLSGATNIGTMTETGGLAAAFDGLTDQGFSASASKSANVSFGGHFVAYVGRNFSGASAQQIASATVYPSTDRGFYYSGSGNYGTVLSISLYAKHTAPSTETDGTLLGTTGLINNLTQAITILSSDAVTAWEYVWCVVDTIGLRGTALDPMTIEVAELQLYGPPGTGTSSTAITLQLLGEPLLYTTPIRVWRLGLFSGTTGYPTTGTYHEGRLWLAGVVDNRLDGGKPNDLFNFEPTKPDGTVTDANAVSYTLNAPDVNAVFWMETDQQGILVGTQAGEWLVQASNLNSPLTPTSMQAHRVTTIGCSNIEPRRTEHTLVFVQKHQRKLMEYFADVFSSKFSAPNLSKDAKHLTERGLSEIAYQQELTPLIWARCEDGSLIGAAYKRESLMSSQGPTFAGWHRHTLGSEREVESICVGPSTDGTLDTLTMVTNDPTTNIRHVEILTNMFEEGADLSTAWHVDSGVVPSMTQTVVLGGVSSFQMSGLWHLNGKTVAVFAGGFDCGDYLVTAGQCAVPFGAAGGLFTPAFVASFADGIPIVVGFTFTSDGQIVRPAVPVEAGARTGPAFAKKRRSQYGAALLVATRGISFGTSFTKMNPAKLTTPGGVDIPVTSLYSGIWRDSLTDDYSYDSMLAWRISRPYPATVALASAFLQTQDA